MIRAAGEFFAHIPQINLRFFMSKYKRKKKRCPEIALIRARQAQKIKGNCFLALLVAACCLLSIRPPMRFPSVPARKSPGIDLANAPTVSREVLRPVTNPRRSRVSPTLRMLVRDLRRPGRCESAAAELADRIEKPDLRDWVLRLIEEDEIYRLAIQAPSGSTDEAILRSWEAQMRRDTEHGPTLADEASDLGAAFRPRRY